MNLNRVAEIERLLGDAFTPTKLLVKDQSHLHAGHAGAREGKGHFDVTIVSERFASHTRLARHRMVYEALGSFMDKHIHALRISALAPAEQRGSDPHTSSNEDS